MLHVNKAVPTACLPDENAVVSLAVADSQGNPAVSVKDFFGLHFDSLAYEKQDKRDIRQSFQGFVGQGLNYC